MGDNMEPTDYYPRRSKWLRAIFIIVILFGYGLGEAILWFLALVQFFWILLKSEPNKQIQTFADTLINWTSIAISFCLWKTDKPPFPFSSWKDDSQ